MELLGVSLILTRYRTKQYPNRDETTVTENATNPEQASTKE